MLAAFDKLNYFDSSLSILDFDIKSLNFVSLLRKVFVVVHAANKDCLKHEKLA